MLNFSLYRERAEKLIRNIEEMTALNVSNVLGKFENKIIFFHSRFLLRLIRNLKYGVIESIPNNNLTQTLKIGDI